MTWLGDPADGKVDAVRPFRVPPVHVPVYPYGAGHPRGGEAAGRERHGHRREQEDGCGDPYGAGEQQDGPEESEGEQGGDEGGAGKEHEDAGENDEGEQADELVVVRHVIAEKSFPRLCHGSKAEARTVAEEGR